MIDDEWVSATSTYNYMMKDPLLDWLKYHHSSFVKKNNHFSPIVNKSLQSNYSICNFTTYIREQGCIFERKVMKFITKKFTSARIAQINGNRDPKNFLKYQDTLNAMEKGYPFIFGATLHNENNKTFGIPDLLVRSDWLQYLVKDAPEIINKSSKVGNYHYVVVDIKFTTLNLRADGIHVLNSGSFPAYKTQLCIYNLALETLQGYLPQCTYILGRRWKYSSKGDVFLGDNCFDKLGVINYTTIDKNYLELTDLAIAWVKTVKSVEASQWDILNYPLIRSELYPNMCNTHDYPWRNIKEAIAKETKELTKLWMVGPKNREIALSKGVSQWTDSECSSLTLGISGEKTAKILDAIIDINQDDKVKILPNKIKNNFGDWKNTEILEFFVDFETCNDIVSTIKPMKIADSIIFMIGVGYINEDKWIYKHFTVDRLTGLEEQRICGDFASYIQNIANGRECRCIHWSHAENSVWNNTIDKHDPVSYDWMNLEWLDLLTVFKTEPIVINNCMSYSLKDVAKAMQQHGFIETSWDMGSECIDGQSAMIAAKRAQDFAKEQGVSMVHVPLMKQIIKYNEVDVKVLAEVLFYLRKNHCTNKRKRIDNSDDLQDESELQQNNCQRKFKRLCRTI